MGVAAEAGVLVATAIDRALTRFAHEMLEGNKGAEGLALAGIVTRGAVLAQRLAERIRELEGTEVPVGTLDISFYRDVVATRLNPDVHRPDLPFPPDGRCVVLVDDVL